MCYYLHFPSPCYRTLFEFSSHRVGLRALDAAAAVVAGFAPAVVVFVLAAAFADFPLAVAVVAVAAVQVEVQRSDAVGDVKHEAGPY